uniref:MADF domain-containing protein n=1 Tax=Panagrolaimus sp. JU765 TaxID=591449 RepID=A0AC34Q114_9BILA
MRSASCRKIVWSEILKECQNSLYFNDKTVQWLFKSKWPGLKSNVEKKFIKSKRLSTIDEEIIETERLKDPLFCFLVGEDRKSVRSDVYDSEEEAPDEDEDFADFDYPPAEETHENVNHFIDDGFDDSDAEVIDFSPPSSHEPNVESCVESEQEHPLKANTILQQIMPNSDECTKAYINFLASIEKEWICLLKLKQEKTKQKIQKTKLEIEKLTNV